MTETEFDTEFNADNQMIVFVRTATMDSTSGEIALGFVTTTGDAVTDSMSMAKLFALASNKYVEYALKLHYGEIVEE